MTLHLQKYLIHPHGVSTQMPPLSITVQMKPSMVSLALFHCILAIFIITSSIFSGNFYNY